MKNVKSKIRRLPVPAGLILALTGLVVGIFIINNIHRLGSAASEGISPKQIKITNIDSSSFVVSWITEEKATGVILYGETFALSESRPDVRSSQVAKQEKFFTHFVSIEELKPETKYFFQILSSGKKYDNSGKPFSVTTASQKAPPDNDIAQGRVLGSEGQPAVGVIVYLSLANTITQAALTDNNGHWIIPLAMARTLDLKNHSNYDREAQIEEILVRGEKASANATLTTGNDNPTPDIILGQTHNFLGQIPELSPTPTQIRHSLLEGGESPASSPGFTENSELNIIYPSEGEEVNTPEPEFLGSGPKAQNINIEVESDQKITTRIKIDEKGNWSWSPPQSLSPGQHRITVSYTDKEGFLKTVSRTFTVLAAGQSNLPSFTATPSGQLTTPTPTPKASPTPTSQPSPTKILTPTPSLLAPTGTATLVSTVTPTPTGKSAGTATPSPPPSGTILPTRLFFSLGIATLLTGIVLFLFF